MTAHVELRPLTPQDAALELLVYAGTREEELRQVPWSDEQKAVFVAQQFAAQSAHYAAHYPGITRDAILVDGQDAGRLLVLRRDGDLRIVDVALLPEFRGRGAGRHVLEQLLAEAARAGCRVSIHVEQTNRARSLYERLGFREVAQEGPYLRMECAPPPAVT